MSKYLVIYESGKFFKSQVGMEIIEAESWEKAYEKASPRFQVQMMRQVNDDAKPQDFKPMFQIEEDFRHKEAMKLSDNEIVLAGFMRGYLNFKPNATIEEIKHALDKPQSNGSN
jgi:hypothetical protein